MYKKDRIQSNQQGGDIHTCIGKEDEDIWNEEGLRNCALNGNNGGWIRENEILCPPENFVSMRHTPSGLVLCVLAVCVCSLVPICVVHTYMERSNRHPPPPSIYCEIDRKY